MAEEANELINRLTTVLVDVKTTECEVVLKEYIPVFGHVSSHGDIREALSDGIPI
jgi:hypothetical protein